MTQGSSGKGGDQRRQQTEQYTPNERMSLGQRLTFVLGQLTTRQGELEAVLPPDIPFLRFHATVNQALRNNPDILECTPVSIVNACVKSAYDGLRLDGREAALVSHNVKIQERGKPDRWEKRAQYFPMVFGLIQQILRGGTVVAIEADIIYENDAYRVIRGTTPAIEHEPLIIGDRGRPVGAYSVAVFVSGYRSTLFMRADEIEDVRKASKSGDKDGNPQGIWLRWWTQMWIKTVIRRHRKTLPVGRDLHDAEANDEFGFTASGVEAALEHQATERPRPQRPAALAHDPSGAGVQLGDQLGDFGFGGEGVVVEGDRSRDEGEGHQQHAQREVKHGSDQLPADATEWRFWSAEISTSIARAGNADAVNAIWRDERARLEAAPQDIRDALSGALSDRIADLASGGGGAGSAENREENPQGER